MTDNFKIVKINFRTHKSNNFPFPREIPFNFLKIRERARNRRPVLRYTTNFVNLNDSAMTLFAPLYSNTKYL